MSIPDGLYTCDPSSSDQIIPICGYVYDPQMSIHASEVGDHPEQPARISEIYLTLVKSGCIARMGEIRGREVTANEVLLIHTKEVWNEIEDLAHITPEKIQETAFDYNRLSLYVCTGTPLASRLSCGGVIEAALAVAQGEYEKAFAIVRPPGHHAEPTGSMGFCFYNNVAVAAKVVQRETLLKRILILDWDVHHGNGTHRAFIDDPSVLYISLHRYGDNFYPGGTLGSMQECGEGKGLGYSVNIPWPQAGMGDADYIHAFMQVVMPIAMEFSPDLVFISAGFDAAEGDQLGQCHVSPVGYAHMTHMLCRLASGRVVVALEGGYNLDSISKSATAVAQTILGDAPPQLPPLVPSPLGGETVWRVAMEQSKYWKSISPKACMPRELVTEPTVPLNAILHYHRQDVMLAKFDMSPVPLPLSLDGVAVLSFHSPNFLNDDTVVIYFHANDQIRGELQPLSTNIELSRSYKVDSSDHVVSWARSEGYGLLDVTVLHNSSNIGDPITYLWDNFIMLAEAAEIILIGQGLGGQSITNLVKVRSANMIKSVRSVIQLVNRGPIPTISTTNVEVRNWYKANSQVYVASTHPIWKDGKLLKKFGSLVSLDETTFENFNKVALNRGKIFILAKLRL